MQRNRSGLYGVALTLLFFAAFCYSQSKPPKLDSSNMPAQLNGTEGSVTGYVRDLACPYRNKSKESAKPPDDSCVRECVKAGAPLGIITEDGMVFNVISHTMPDTDQRARLLPYVAQTVHATGRVFERNGAHAIAIDKIEVVSKMIRKGAWANLPTRRSVFAHAPFRCLRGKP